MKKVIVSLLAVFILTACSHTLKTAIKDDQIAPSFNDTLLTGDYLWVRGFGSANPQHDTPTQRRIMSREAAIAHAYQRASEVLYGADVESHVQIVDSESYGSTIDTSTKGMIQRMELVSTEYLEDGGCSVIMRLDRSYLKQAGLDPETKK